MLPVSSRGQHLQMPIEEGTTQLNTNLSKLFDKVVMVCTSVLLAVV